MDDPFDLVGDVLDGQFRVDAFAGEGDLSVVYKGHHLGVDAPVAIKCLNLPETLDPTLARPLVDGFKEASRVHYRLARGNLHIAQTIASGSTLVPRSGVVVPYLVREWFEGESLASDLARRRAQKESGRPIEEALALLETAFDGIAHAHAQGEVHLSINPSNLFVVRPVAGSGPAPAPSLKVLDFGVAQTMNTLGSGIAPGRGGPRPLTGLRLLFPAYAAPEQLDRNVGPLGPWTDVYAIALVMMEVLSDRVVMGEHDSGAIVEHALDEQRRPTPQAHGLKLPSHIERALGRAVARAPDRRQKSAAELWKDVRNTVRTMSSRSMVATPLPHAAIEVSAARSTAPLITPPWAPSQTPAPMPSRTLTPMPSRTLTPMPSRTLTPMPSRTLTPMPSRAPIPASSTPSRGPLPATGPLPPPPRLRAPTLVGLSPPAIHAIPGAGENRNRIPSTPSIVTQPMSFDPRGPSHLPPIDDPTAAAAEEIPSASEVTNGAPIAPIAPPVAPSTSGAPMAPVATELATMGAIASGAYATELAKSTVSSVPSARPAADVLPRDLAPVQVIVTPAGAAMAAPSVAPQPPWSADPPLAAPSSRGPVEPWRPQRRLQDPLRRILTPRSTPIVLSIAGGLFWCWAFGVYLWLFALTGHHPARASLSPSATAAEDAIPAASAITSTPIASIPATTPAPAPQTTRGAIAEPGVPAAASGPFRNASAVRALDGKWREVAKCRRGKVWGKAATTVTFANDGSVTHIEVGAPFAGTPTADCISDTLATTRVAPFDEKAAVMVYRVYVAPN